jgi:hypothetical protein
MTDAKHRYAHAFDVVRSMVGGHPMPDSEPTPPVAPETTEPDDSLESLLNLSGFPYF